MTKLEEKFYKTFGIEKKELTKCNRDDIFCPYPEKECNINCPYYKVYKTDYPPITDHILLELVCILAKQYNIDDAELTFTQYLKTELKNEILDRCILFARYIKSDVRKLFEE